MVLPFTRVAIPCILAKTRAVYNTNEGFVTDPDERDSVLFSPLRCA